jgi:hypothetical protein
MVERNGFDAELEEQRCLIEEQQFQMQRQERHIQLLRQFTVALQNELDALRSEVHTRSQPAPQKPGDGHEPHTARRHTRENLPSSSVRS